MIMKTILSILALALLYIPVLGQGNSDNCLNCHLDWEDDDGPAHKITRDVHFQKGLGCADCHGGNTSADDMDDVRESRDYIGIPDFLKVPDFCAHCHSDAAYMHEHNPSLPVDQLAKYKTSIHGQRLFGRKDKKVANCVSCHSVHEVGGGRMPHSSTHPVNLPQTCGKCHADTEYMAEYGISTSQLDEFTNSIHGQALLERNDLGAPACNDCHGNHGAAPPGVNSLAAVCGLCHAIEAELFNRSPHAEAFRENDIPMCEICHSNHFIIKPSDSMIGSEEPAICTDCHSADDGTIGFMTADSLRVSIDNLVRFHGKAQQTLDEAIAKGMMTTDEEFLMKEVDQSLIQTRMHIHAFNIDSVEPKAKLGIAKADSVRVMSAELIDEYYFRRQGLAVATLIITFLAIMLYRKIRKIEK